MLTKSKLSILIISILLVTFLGRIGHSAQPLEKETETIAKLTPEKMEEYEKQKQDAINGFVKEGIEYFKKQKYIEAKVQFEKALKLDPTHAQSLDYLKKCDSELSSGGKSKKTQPTVNVEEKSKPTVPPTETIAKDDKKQKEEEMKKAEADKKAAEGKAKAEEKERLTKERQEKKIAELKAADDKKRQQAEELAAKKKADEEKRQQAEAAKKTAAEKAAQEAATKNQGKNSNQEKVAAEKAAKEQAQQEELRKKEAQKEQERKKREEELAAKKKADEEKQQQAEFARKQAEEKKAQEKVAKESEQKRLTAEKAAKEKAQQAEIQRKKEAEQKEKEKIAAEKIAKEKEQQEEIQTKKMAEQREKERLASEKAAKEKAPQEEIQRKKEAEQKEKERLASEKAQKESQQKAEQEKIAKAKADADAQKKAEIEKAAQAKAEADAQKKTEVEKTAQTKAEVQKKAEQERIAKAQMDAEAKAKADAAKAQRDAEKKRKDDVQLHLTKGKELYRSVIINELTQAVQEFDMALSMDPGNSDAVRYRALALAKIGKQQRAENQALEKKTQEETKKSSTSEPVKVEPVIAKQEPVQVTKSEDTVSNEEKARQEALKRADDEEKRVRAEREREESARKAKEADDHYKAGITYLNQGQVLKAHDEWNATLALVPSHQGAKAMIEETRIQYEAALETQRKQQESARLEGENDKRMNDPIITIDVADQEIGDILTQMAAVAGFNVVIGEGVKAKVSASFTNVSLKKALDTLLPINGFKYIRQGDIIQVSLDLRSKIYTLTDDQVKKLRFAMIEDKILQRQLYGPDAKSKVPGQELILDERAHLLSVTDSGVNIGKVDEFLQNLPPIRAEELITKTYTLRSGNSDEIRKLVQALLTASPVKGIPDEERKVILEPGSNTLVIRDSVENIKKVEDFLVDKHFLDKLTNQELTVKVYHLSNEESATTPEALARKAELVQTVGEVLETMLYAVEGREKAYESGRRIFKDAHFGTITVVDTPDNLRKIDDYVAQLPTGQEQKLLSKVFKIRNADPNNLRNVINQIIQESRPTNGASGGVGDYVTGIISPGAGNGLTFLDATVELIDLTGDTTNPQARLYIYSPTRDREVTLSKGNSELVDQYRVRLINADIDRQEAEVEIRLASFASVQRSLGNFNNQPNTINQQTGQPNTNQTGDQQTQTYRRPTLRVDRDTNNIIVLAFDPSDLTMIDEWISKLDVPILQVSIEAKFVDVNETKAKKMGVDWLVPSLSNWGSFSPKVDSLSFGRNVSGRTDAVSGANSTDPLLADITNNSLISGSTFFQFETVGGLSMTLETLEAEGVINIINAPRITALNQQRATLTISQDIPWISPTYTITAATQTAPGAAAFTVGNTYTHATVAISLDVTPTIHSDGSIILDISPQVDKLVDRLPNPALLPTQTVFNLAGVASPVSGQQEWTSYGEPAIDRRTFKTRARVNDGGTIVLGGLIQEKEHTAETKVPILGDIPVIKYLFKKSIDYKEKTRLYIFLTATVVP